MTNAAWSRRDCLEWRLSQNRQRVLRARAVCSKVNSERSGFFPPQPVGLFGDEQEDQLAKDHMSEEALVTSAFKMSKAQLGFGQAEDMLDAGAGEGDFQEDFQGGFGRGV